MFKTAEKGNKVSNLFKKLFEQFKNEIDKKLFRFMVKQGLILCAVPEGDSENESSDEDGEEETTEEVEETSEDGEDEETVVSIGDEVSPTSEDEKPAAEWVRDLRANQRELKRENQELKEKLEAVSGTKQKPVELGEKPTLESCEWDTEKFERDLENWHTRKAEADQKQREAQVEADKANQAWQEKLAGFEKLKADLKVKDFEEVAEIVTETLSNTQRGIIVKGCKNSALVIYALGKNPKKLKELAAIKDPVDYTFAISDLEKQLKVGTRKTPPAPEKKVSSTGGASLSGATDSTLERLRVEAEKSGDYSKVTEYKRQLRSKAA